MAKYLDQTGVQILWTKTKEKIASEIATKAPASHTHKISDISGLAVELQDRPTREDIFSDSESAGNEDILTKAGVAMFIDTAYKGQNNGLASLDGSGKVPTSQLPSYVDDVLEFANQTAFPQTGEDGKIYVAEDTNKTYRWSGTAYVEISASLALGETALTAYAGNKGKANADAIAALRTGKANTNHTHTSAQITDLQGKLDAKANATHTHAISDVTNLQNTLDSKSSVSHNHDDKYVALDNSGGTRNYRYQIKYNQSNTPLTIRGWKNPNGTGVDEGQIVLGESYDYPVIIKALATNQPQNDYGKILRFGKQYGLQIGPYNSGNNPDTKYYDVLDSSMALTEDELNSILV